MGLLETLSLRTVMCIRVRLLISRSPQTPRKRNSH